jgi:hypothetical protein
VIEATIDAGQETPVEESGSLTLDPFSFLPGVASRVAGLGGNAPGHDPTYVFHTPYVKAGPGRVTATIRFDGLVAKRGTLVLRIHVLPSEEGARAQMVNSERILLNRLLTQGGEVSINFEAFRDMTYAVLGQIPDNTDAYADNLTVRFDSQQDRYAGRAAFAEARSTTFGSDKLRPTARLISLEPATLAQPVSQMCTAAQLDEPVCRDWGRRLGEPKARDRRLWERAYVLQVLTLYGMLEPDARGIGFGVEDGGLPALMAAAGVSVTVANSAGPFGGGDAAVGNEGIGDEGVAQRLLRPEICDERVFAEKVNFRSVDLTDIPHDLVNFDFSWSSSVSSTLGSVAAGQAFIEHAMECLRPNGIAVHVFDFDPTVIEQTVPSGAPYWRRREVEQAALGLISRGHEVAEVKLVLGPQKPRRRGWLSTSGGAHLDGDDGQSVTSFGLIARKAPAPL